MERNRVFKDTMNGFTINLLCLTELSEDEAMTLRKAVRHMALKMGSKDFEVFCKYFSYRYESCSGRLWWKKCKVKKETSFKSSNGRDGIMVYNHLMSGKEVLSDNPNRAADITLVVDRRNRRGVLGYTYPNSIKQWIYSWFLKSDYKKVAGNLAHEWCHKMGYDHAFRYNNTRAYTVPYAVGYYVSSDL